MKQQLTKAQAIEEMKKGHKVTHRFFSDDEWVTMQGNIIRMEQGQGCWASQFWKDRDGAEWEYNWELWEESAPTPSSTEPEQESEAGNNDQTVLEVAIGHEVAKLLNLKFGKDGRTKTGWGTKSIQGLGASTTRIVEEQTERLR